MGAEGTENSSIDAFGNRVLSFYIPEVPFDITFEVALKIERITLPERYFLLTQTGDEILDWREAVEFCGGAWQSVRSGGDHAFEHFDHEIPAILRFVLGVTP